MTAQRVRASNGQREQVVEQLNKALVEGRLSPSEFEERSTRAHHAMWVDELSQFTTDLPHRVTFDQRAHVVEQLGEAASHGYLRFEEFEERSAAVSRTVWREELADCTRDLPDAFRTTASAAGPAEKQSVRRFVRNHPVAAGVAALVATLSVGISISLLASSDADPPAELAAPIVTPAVVSVPPPSTTAPASAPAAATTAATSEIAAPPPFTIECSVGESGDKKTFTSLKAAWAENGGTYFCEATVPESHRLTKLERSAVVLDQRMGNGESNIESLGVLLELCADTMKFEFNYDDILDPKSEPRPFTVDDYKKFASERLEAMYKLCPSAPTARRMREAIYSG